MATLTWQELLEYLQETGQVGRMPTKIALEEAGRKKLAPNPYMATALT